MTTNDADRSLTMEQQDQRIASLTAQRDELHKLLREAKDGFTNGRFTATRTSTADGIADFATFLMRCDAALLRCDVRERLDDRVAAEQRKQEAAP